VLSLLILLVSNAERMVSKDEIVEKIWNGRIISDAAIASRIKAARSALGDDGSQQRLVHTIHGKGFRFIGNVRFTSSITSPRLVELKDDLRATDERPSIAVMPFKLIGDAGPLTFVADALADELITDLARLHWLLVIARASTFRFRGRHDDCIEIGSALNVRYCLNGTLQSDQDSVTLSVKLSNTSNNAIIWAERFTCSQVELHDLRHEILANIVSKLEIRIVQQEVEMARWRQDTGLDAWSSYHLGLDHMFRFNKSDNAQAALLFERSLSYNPHFSRALSGMSFTCFQDSFLQYSSDSEGMAQRARLLAEQALNCDPLDPFAHLNLGRSLWFDNAIPESLDRLGECIALSPNYAQAIYSKAWAEMTQCDAVSSESDAALAMRLSPLDPLRYAMLAVRSVSAMLQSDYKTAANLGEMAARSPGAHKHIAVIAAITTQADGRFDQAVKWISKARQLDPSVTPDTFFRSFPFVPSSGRELIESIFRDLRFQASNL
ncbi:MAG: winged helix-turn-helix domain-containing protein, partial [Sphingorhabdus sp.]